MFLFTLIFLTLIAYVYLSIRYWYFRKPLEPIEQNEITISQTRNWKNNFLSKYFEPSPYICTECTVKDIEDLSTMASLRWDYVKGDVLLSSDDLKQESLHRSEGRKGIAWSVYVQESVENSNTFTTVRVYYTQSKYTDILLRPGHAIFIPKKMLKWELLENDKVTDDPNEHNNYKLQTFYIYDYFLLGVLV